MVFFTTIWPWRYLTFSRRYTVLTNMSLSQSLFFSTLTSGAVNELNFLYAHYLLVLLLAYGQDVHGTLRVRCCHKFFLRRRLSSNCCTKIWQSKVWETVKKNLLQKPKKVVFLGKFIFLQLFIVICIYNICIWRFHLDQNLHFSCQLSIYYLHAKMYDLISHLDAYPT